MSVSITAATRGQQLTVQHPSTAAVAFTVSTRQRFSSSSTWHIASVLVRMLAILMAMVPLLNAWSDHTNPHHVPAFLRLQVRHFPLLPRPSSIEYFHNFFQEYSDQWPLHYRINLAVGILLLASLRFHTTETCLVLRTLGLQVSSSSRCYLIPHSQRFIPTSEIQDIFIHEAFRGSEVRHYLAVVVKQPPGGQVRKQIVVVFPQTLPSLAVVEQVWRGARACLYDT